MISMGAELHTFILLFSYNFKLQSSLNDFSVPDLNTLQFFKNDNCPDGLGMIPDGCSTCGPGTFYDSASRTCQPCAIGSYQQQSGQTQCITCDGSTTTETQGAKKRQDCKRKTFCSFSSFALWKFDCDNPVLNGFGNWNSGKTLFLLRVTRNFLTCSLKCDICNFTR